MKMKLAEVRVAHANLMALSHKKLPHKLAYAVAKNLMKLESESKLIEERRMEMITTYVVKDEEGNPVIKDARYDLGNNEENFNKEYTEFMETETEIDIHTISCTELDMLDDSRYDVLTAAEMIALDFMLETDCTGATTE